MVTWWRKIFLHLHQKAQRENLLLEVVTRGREKRGFLGYLRRHRPHIPYSTLFSLFFYIFVIFSSFYLCALFKRCNEASRQRHNSLRRTREKLLFFNKLGSFLCCDRVIYVRRYFIFLLMYEGKLLCTDYDLLHPLLCWSLQLFILISQWQKRHFAMHEAFRALFSKTHLKALNNNVACFSPQCFSWMNLLHDQILTPTVRFEIARGPFAFSYACPH